MKHEELKENMLVDDSWGNVLRVDIIKKTVVYLTMIYKLEDRTESNPYRYHDMSEKLKYDKAHLQFLKIKR